MCAVEVTPGLPSWLSVVVAGSAAVSEGGLSTSEREVSVSGYFGSPEGLLVSPPPGMIRVEPGRSRCALGAMVMNVVLLKAVSVTTGITREGSQVTDPGCGASRESCVTCVIGEKTGGYVGLGWSGMSSSDRDICVTGAKIVMRPSDSLDEVVLFAVSFCHA